MSLAVCSSRVLLYVSLALGWGQGVKARPGASCPAITLTNTFFLHTLQLTLFRTYSTPL
jgi:hypothetical protein